MRKRENELKAALMRELRGIPGFLAVRREDSLRSGMPDVELHGLARSTFWEGKHLAPGEPPETTSVQFLTMLRLEAASFGARYVLWIGGGGDSTSWAMAVRPSRLAAMDADVVFQGHDHISMAEWMAGRHRAGR